MEDPTKYEREVLLEETKNIFLKAISRVQWYPYSDPIVVSRVQWISQLGPMVSQTISRTIS
jgi:hypothetical protein